MRDYMTVMRVVFNHPQLYETYKLTVARSRDNASRIHGCVLPENPRLEQVVLPPAAAAGRSGFLFYIIYTNKIVTAF